MCVVVTENYVKVLFLPHVTMSILLNLSDHQFRLL